MVDSSPDTFYGVNLTRETKATAPVFGCSPYSRLRQCEGGCVKANAEGMGVRVVGGCDRAIQSGVYTCNRLVTSEMGI